MTPNEEISAIPANAKSELDTSKASSLLLIFLVIPLIGILIALLMLANQIRSERFNLNNDNPPNPTTLTSASAPQFQLPSLAGNTISLADYRGKILFLNFWQTTCPPCLRELPDFVAFIDEQPDDVTWLTVNVDESAEMVETYFNRHNFSNIPVVLDTDWTVARDYAVIGFPITYVLDSEGIVRYVNVGELRYDQMNLILESIRAET